MAADLRLGIIIRANSGNLPATLDDTRNRLNGVRQSTGSVNREFAEMARQTFDVGGAFRAMAAGLSAIALFQGVRSLIDFADTMKLLDGRIQLATTSVQDYARANAALVEISMHTGTAFEANATLFSRINTSLRIMGGTTQTTLQFTELLAKGLRISGAAASEASSVIRQLAQAMASGVVRGDEFNSIMENGSRVAQALADGLHVDIGVLRKMAEAGELSAGKVANALLSQSAILDAEFKRMPLTVSAALENIKTAFGQYISVADQGSAATASLSGSLNSLAQNLPAVLDSVITLAKIAIGYFAATITGGIIHYGQSVLIARA
ncbi:MAG: phage tail tape measure protein, partial [Methylovulum sp.]